MPLAGGPPPGHGEYLGLPVGAFLRAVSEPRPDPGGGATAALTAALAAALCAMSAELSSRQLAGAERLASEARELRDRAAPLAQADVESYRAVLTALRDPSAGRRLADALAGACEVPEAVARISARVAELAALVAAEGNPRVRGDAVTAALLAAAAARAAAVLVRINLGAAGAGPAGDRARDTERLAGEAARLAAETAGLAG